MSRLVERDGSTADPELMADAVRKIAAGITAMQSVASEDLVVLLLHDLTKVGKRDIEKILRAAPLLAKRYLKPAGAK